jgi:hypothetical protein
MLIMDCRKGIVWVIFAAILLSTASAQAAPTIPLFMVNQTDCTQGDVLLVSSSILEGDNPLDQWWFTYNGTLGNMSAAVNGTNDLIWFTDALEGNYTVAGHVNDTNMVQADSGDFFVNIIASTTTTTSTTTSTTTTTIATTTTTLASGGGGSYVPSDTTSTTVAPTPTTTLAATGAAGNGLTSSQLATIAAVGVLAYAVAMGKKKK